MKYMFPRKSLVCAFIFALALIFVSFSASEAQSKKGKTSDKKAVPAKKVERASKDARRSSKPDARKKDVAAKKDTARKTASKGDRNAQAKKDTKTDKRADRAEVRKVAAERRRIEAERRAAVLAEARRREQARREAIARKLAAERGLRNETLANILRDDTTGEDPAIRQAAIAALGEHAGSVVVMEAQTGKVLTIVNQDWAVLSSIRPCSTVKLVTGVAALNEGIISKVDGSIRNTSTRRKLDDAIAFSDNGYFQRAGAQLGNDKLVEYGRKLGLGQPTGLNVAGEATGRLPTNNNSARIYSHGDDTEVSTIQLAVMAAAITNGGHRVLPRVPRNTAENTNFQTFYRGNVEVVGENMRRVIPGMMGAAEYGTARRNMDQGLGVAGKTGSCIDKGSWVGLFASVAPIEQPKYAVAVITRGQRERGRYAAAVAADVYRALASRIVRTDKNLAQTEFKLPPRDQKVLRTVPITDDDEDADDAMAGEKQADDVDASENDRGIILVPSSVRPALPPTGKLVKKTVDSKPIFAPVVITPADQAKKKRERIVQDQPLN